MHAHDWIARLALAPHPEGGFYREVYRADDVIPAQALPPRFPGDRSVATSIYYLLEAGNFSAFHRIRSDEIWHFYAGGPLELHLVSEGNTRTVRLGLEADPDMAPQVVIPHGVWFAAEPCSTSEYSLVGCTVSPGFDFKDFEFGAPDLVFKGLAAVPPNLTRFFRSPPGGTAARHTIG